MPSCVGFSLLRCCCSARHRHWRKIIRPDLCIVVGFPAGGPTDVIARIVAQNLRQSRPAILCRIFRRRQHTASGQVARATPDGYTIMNSAPASS
jgi:tripartite-type tricarboxylate transporter receptor subunit TctC